MSRPASIVDRQAMTWKPVMLNPRLVADRTEIARLSRKESVRVCDRLRDQLAELVRAEQPKRRLTSVEEADAISSRLNKTRALEYGLWFYYPWSGALVHVLPMAEFRALRTDRNRLKILPLEQERLGRARIAIAGLSVGLAAATTLVLEGVGGRFALADFDALGLSNLNRLLAPVCDLGLNKTVIAARRLLELDPYLHVEIFPEGVTDENLDAFLGSGSPGPSLLVEECDDLYIKIRLRERARELGMPVLMETSDGGMLDIERFDLEPRRDLLHGLVPGINAAALRDLATKDKVPIVLRILGLEHLSARTAASLVEIGQTISTWPQLASSVALGGALVSDAARRVLLGTLTTSGRWRLDLGRLVDEQSRDMTTPGDTAVVAQSERCDRTDDDVAREKRSRAMNQFDTDVNPDLMYLVEHACLAPSGGNSQPWRFVADETTLECYIDAERSASHINFRHLGSYVALGAATENMVLAAHACGLEVDVEFPRATSLREPVCRVTVLGKTAPVRSRLFDEITRRCTNRRRGERDPLHVGQRIALDREAAPGKLVWLESQTDLERLGVLHGRADRLRFLSESMHRELMGELRWTPDDAERTGDGLDIRSLELSATDRSALDILSDWRTLSVLKQINGGRALEEMTRRTFEASSAIAVLQVPGRTPLDYLAGGRALQRTWLAATAEGLAVHPQATLVYLLARLEHEPESLSCDEREELEAIREEFRAMVPAHGGSDVLVLRISRARAPSVRSRRRPLHHVLQSAARPVAMR